LVGEQSLWNSSAIAAARVLGENAVIHAEATNAINDFTRKTTLDAQSLRHEKV
jgi:hypothetical protein